MTNPTQEDVLSALKRCRRLAKQDLLTSSITSDPAFWRRRAERRREVYQTLSELVRESGVSMAYRRAWRWYRRASTDTSDASSPDQAPQLEGERDALETFLKVVGIRPKKVKALRRSRLTVGKSQNATANATASDPIG